FVSQSVDAPEILARLNWDDTKQNTAGLLVNLLSRGQRYQPALLRLMADVTAMEDFRHLERLEDGELKARPAREAGSPLALLVSPQQNEQDEAKRAEERRRTAEEAALRVQGEREKLAALRREFFEVIATGDPQTRGYRLERFLRELFSLFDLDPKASFK